ncbi:MAG: hypothetical protein U1D00_30740 [Mycobacterium sp.]|nr:hypothetical protein [Mycobacterium sp.]
MGPHQRWVADDRGQQVRPEVWVDAGRADGRGVDVIGASGAELVGDGATVQREDP